MGRSFAAAEGREGSGDEDDREGRLRGHGARAEMLGNIAYICIYI